MNKTLRKKDIVPYVLGYATGKRQMTKKMIDLGIDVELIARLIDISLEEIERLKLN